MTEHNWVGPNPPIRWEHCSICYVIRRLDGKPNGPCRGRPKIELRDDPTPTTPTEERPE